MKHGFGIIGAGEIAEVHARAIDTIMDVELIRVYDLNPVNILTFSQQFNCKPYGSTEELCNDSKTDIVCICTPSDLLMVPLE